MTPVLGPEATPRARLSHGHVKSASISAGSGNSQSTLANREAAPASASAAERDSTRWRQSGQSGSVCQCMLDHVRSTRYLTPLLSNTSPL